MRSVLLLILIDVFCSINLNGQPQKTYFSFEEAVANQEQVYKLRLRNIDKLPEEILQFKNLKELSINGLAYFPEQLLQLTNLEVLNLMFHQLDAIPEGIDQLQSLRVLKVLGTSKPVLLPSSLDNLANLEELSLSQNGLVNLPDLSGLIKLKKLNLGYNNIIQLPDFFANLISLEELSLARNKLSTLPPSFGKLKALKSLDIKNNQLVNLPSVLFECEGMQELDLYKNGIKQIPGEFNKLIELKKLDLSHNQLTELPASFSRLEQLEELDIKENPFNQILPQAVYDLTTLKKLSYSIFKLKYEDSFKSRPLSNGICALQNLEELDISALELTSIPTCFGSLKNLKRLSISMSPKSYLFPTEITQLTNLERLKYVSRGYPIRELPADMRKLSMLKYLEIEKNQLSETQKAQLNKDLPNCRVKIK